jgi:hypothetical protein
MTGIVNLDDLKLEVDGSSLPLGVTADQLISTSEVLQVDTPLPTVVGDRSPILIVQELIEGPPGVKGDQGIQGPPGSGAGVLLRTTTSVINGHRVVVDSNGSVEYLSLLDLSHGARVLGITQNAALTGDISQVQYSGELVEPSWNWIPDLPVYGTNNGMLTQTPPTSGFVITLGVAMTATSIFINIQQAIYLA